MSKYVNRQHHGVRLEHEGGFRQRIRAGEVVDVEGELAKRADSHPLLDKASKEDEKAWQEFVGAAPQVGPDESPSPALERERDVADALVDATTRAVVTPLYDNPPDAFAEVAPQPGRQELPTGSEVERRQAEARAHVADLVREAQDDREELADAKDQGTTGTTGEPKRRSPRGKKAAAAKEEEK